MASVQDNSSFSTKILFVKKWENIEQECIFNLKGSKRKKNNKQIRARETVWSFGDFVIRIPLAYERKNGVLEALEAEFANTHEKKMTQ